MESHVVAGSRRRKRSRGAVRCQEVRRRSVAFWSLDASALSGTSPDGKHFAFPHQGGERKEEEEEEEGGSTGCVLGEEGGDADRHRR